MNLSLKEKPICFEKMKEVAAQLTKDIEHVRMDLYEVDGKVYFSEFTFYDWGGLMKFRPSDWDSKLGELIHLPFER